jgi:23S rRNA (cytidine1920-2'-O)/16S rRNA (cytidine1409-2'-O)-methyltransferase
MRSTSAWRASRACARARVIAFEDADIRASSHLRGCRSRLVAIDVSFTSLKLVLPAALALAKPRAAHRADQAAVRGRPRAPQERHRARPRLCMPPVCEDIAAAVCPRWMDGFAGSCPLPILGGDGNREFFIGAQRD